MVYVNGTHARLWPYGPDWSSEVRINYEYRTEVITSRGGQEQRIAVRDKPRVNFDFRTMQHGAGLRSMVSFLAAWQNCPTLMPDWSRPIRLALSPVAGDTTIEVLSLDVWMVDGMTVALIDGEVEGAVHEVSMITSVGANTLTLDAELSRDMSIETLVYPCYSGRLGTQMSGQQHGFNTASLAVTFSVDPGFESIGDPTPASLIFDGREVFLIEPSYTSDPVTGFNAVLDTVDYGCGRLSHFRSVAFNDRLHNATYLGVGREEADALRDLFLRQSGQQGEFFMPTFSEDLRLKTDTSTGADTLRIAGTEAFQNYAADQVYRALIVFYLDGTHEIYRVSAVTSISDTGGDDTLVRIVPSAPHVISQEDIQMICWLPLWRFVSDQLAIQWVTDELANVGFAFKTLQYNIAED